MNIAKFFDMKVSKKRFLSSKQSEMRWTKEVKKNSRNETAVNILDHVFAEGLNNLKSK